MRTADRERAEFLAWSFESFPRFCALLDIVRKDGVRCKLTLNQIQKLFVAARTGRDVILKPRQVGFTTLEQARDIWYLLTVPGARVVATCQSIATHEPAKLLSQNYRVMFEGLERAGLKLDFRTRSSSEWVLADRDASLRIVEAGASEAAAEKKGRAGTISRLHLTETAFYEYADATLNAMLECVPSQEHGSEIISESTPNGASGYFYKQCKIAQSSGSSYRLHFYPWFRQTEYALQLDPGETIEPHTDRERMLARIGVTAQQLKWYRSKVADKGQNLVDQEYPSDPETCFLVSGRCFFEQSVTTALLAKCKQPIETRERGRVRIYINPEPGQEYLIAADTSEGIEDGDSSGAIVYNWRTGEHCATIDGKYPPFELARALVELGRYYNEAVIAVERNNHGHAVLLTLDRELHYPYARIYRSYKDQKPGWHTNAETRPIMLDGLEDGHRKGLWTSPDSRVLSQMRTFVVNDQGKAEAAKGEHDDLVIPAAIGWEIRQKPKFQYSGAPSSMAMM